MSTLICRLSGARGRRMAVYDNKCVITTDVSLGSILTSNALDGQKTLFYLDIQGVQFKKCGLALGYLQFETASVQMNNRSSNMFSENTFTFESSDVSNSLMEKIHDYIVDRIESYKYGTPAQPQFLFSLVNEAQRTSACTVSSSLVAQLEEQMKEQKQQRELELAEKQRIEREAKRQADEEFRRLIQGSDDASQLELFFSQAAECTRIMELQTLWERFDWDEHLSETIGKRIAESARIERLYGNDPRSLTALMNDIKSML